MKTILFNAESKVYETPVISEIKVNVERGFALSGDGDANIETPEEDGEF